MSESEQSGASKATVGTGPFPDLGPRTWRVNAVIGLPTRSSGILEGDPPREVFHGIVTVMQRCYSEGVLWRLGAAQDHLLAPRIGPFHEPAVFTAWMADLSAAQAIDLVTSSLEPLVDFLAVQAQEGVHIWELEILDVTPPVEIGEERNGVYFPPDRGFEFPKSERFRHLGQSILAPAVYIAPPTGWQEQHVRAARNWYVKGLASNLDADRFIFFWIAAEVLYDSQSVIRMMVPPTCPNDHPLGPCPECGATPSKRDARGKGIQRFLEDVGAMSAEDATKVWRLLQMVHGAIRFNSREFDEVSYLAHTVERAVLRMLKLRLGWPPEMPPILAEDGWFVAGALLGIIKKVVEDDLPRGPEWTIREHCRRALGCAPTAGAPRSRQP